MLFLHREVGSIDYEVTYKLSDMGLEVLFAFAT